MLKSCKICKFNSVHVKFMWFHHASPGRCNSIDMHQPEVLPIWKCHVPFLPRRGSEGELLSGRAWFGCLVVQGRSLSKEILKFPGAWRDFFCACMEVPNWRQRWLCLLNDGDRFWNSRDHCQALPLLESPGSCRISHL